MIRPLRLRLPLLARPAAGPLLAAVLLPAALLPTSAGAETAARQTLRVENELASDQDHERIAVYLDDVKVGELTVDAKHPRASLKLALSRPIHRYRLEGDTVLDGVRHTIVGRGLIVTADRMDDIAERASTAAEAVERYRALVAELEKEATGADLECLRFASRPKADAAAVAAAEKRLGVDLPAGYERLVTTLGPFELGSDASRCARVLSPAELATAVDHYVSNVREDGWDDEGELRQLTKRIGKRFPAARRDVVLDFFELSDPTILVAGHRCSPGKTPIALPSDDFDLLGIDPGDNAFLEMITYDDIMGEPECMDYDRLLAYSLHDHLIGMAHEALFVRNDGDEALSFYRARVDGETRTIWMRWQGHGDDDE